ncbi:MAG: alpha/beta hydrolase [Fimbriimonadaceae bacterium]|nr:alpha/beta hydrolase [Alphaproteobacteria bacterium]
MSTTSETNTHVWRDIYFTARDGLRLHARDYGSRLYKTTPVLCLPGLTRNSKDFHALACHLSAHPDKPRRVVALDYRGRGLSAYDPDWENYTPQVEVRDVLDLLPACGLTHVSVFGTSRGGILAMLMAVMRPATLASVVLNDVGPVLGAEGLARIKGYVGKVPPVRDWQDAANLVAGMNRHHFTDENDETWMRFARRTFKEKDGVISPDYDLHLAKQLAKLNLSVTLPTMWPQFDALSHIPTMAIRGANSDLLEPETLEQMAEHHTNLDIMEVDGAGHAPLLEDAPTLKRIAAFLGRQDQ